MKVNFECQFGKYENLKELKGIIEYHGKQEYGSKDLELIGGAREIETQSTSIAMQHRHKKNDFRSQRCLGPMA